MKTLLATLVVLFSVTALADIGVGIAPPSVLKFNGAATEARYSWMQGPQVPNESVLRINWVNAATQSPMDLSKSFRVTIDMPSMPMKNPPTKVSKVLDQNGKPLLGVYDVSSIYFSMGGDWRVQVTVTYPDGGKETQAFDVQLDGAID